jgi:hypothetical protein
VVQIGAAIIIIAVAIDPFSQQLVQYGHDDRFFNEPGRVTVSRAERYSKGTESFKQLADTQSIVKSYSDQLTPQVF